MATEPINITDGIPSEVYVGIGRGRYDGEDGKGPDLYGLARDVVTSINQSRACEREQYTEVLADLVMAAALYQSRVAYRDPRADRAIRDAGKYLTRLLTFSAPGSIVEETRRDGDRQTDTGPKGTQGTAF